MSVDYKLKTKILSMQLFIKRNKLRFKVLGILFVAIWVIAFAFAITTIKPNITIMQNNVPKKAFVPSFQTPLLVLTVAAITVIVLSTIRYVKERKNKSLQILEPREAKKK